MITLFTKVSYIGRPLSLQQGQENQKLEGQIAKTFCYLLSIKASPKIHSILIPKAALTLPIFPAKTANQNREKERKDQGENQEKFW